MFAFGLTIPAHAYRDLETGEFITKDPSGFVDGPNQYTYVQQNPWTKFDPSGLQGVPNRNMTPDQYDAVVESFRAQASVQAPASVQTPATSNYPKGLTGMTGYLLATGVDGVLNASVALFGGTGKGAYTPNPVRTSLELPIFGQEVSAQQYRQLQDSAEDFVTALTAPAAFGASPRFENFLSQPYGKLSGKLAEGTQAGHLNQDGAYGGVIPYKQGLAYPLQGNAITDVGSAHYEYHSFLEDFFDLYRPDMPGSLYPERPTNSDYLAASQKALQNAAVPIKTAKQLSEEAATQLQQFGLQPSDPIPNLPSKMNQKQRTPAGNGSPQ